jgi:hypothetical protein
MGSYGDGFMDCIGDAIDNLLTLFAISFLVTSILVMFGVSIYSLYWIIHFHGW